MRFGGRHFLTAKRGDLLGSPKKVAFTRSLPVQLAKNAPQPFDCDAIVQELFNWQVHEENPRLFVLVRRL